MISFLVSLSYMYDHSCYAFLVTFESPEFQIGLAVGDIDTIRKTAALERYTSQVLTKIYYTSCSHVFMG